MSEDFAPIHRNGMWALPTTEVDRLSEIFFKTDPMVSHEVYHMMCKDLYAQVIAKKPSSDSLGMREKGFQKISQLLSKEDSQSLCSKITEWNENIQSRPEDLKALEEHEIGLKSKVGPIHWKDVVTPSAELSYMQKVVEKILQPKLVGIIEGALQSHFRLDHYLLSRTFPASESLGSFLWHRDGAPRAQLHLMVYLTDSKPDGSAGATECLPFVQSERVGDMGYTYVSPANRTNDLSQFDPEVRAHVERPHMKNGDGLLFFSSRVLHRGIPPLADHRDVLTLVFLPDLNPWHMSMNQLGFERLKARGFGDATLYRHPAAL